MTGREDNARLLMLLGLAMTLPMILLSGPLAGFLIAEVLIKKLGWSRILVPILSGLGFLGSGIQTFRLIQKMRRLSPK